MLRFHRLEVLRRLPHPGRGFTQGLIVAGDTVWESTGLYGQSSLRRYRLGAAEAEQCAPLPPELFGEGICRAGAEIWQLTWRERVALRWDPQAMTTLGTVPYNREGWGICAAGDQLLSSDGSSELVRRDPRPCGPPACSGSAATAAASLASTTWTGRPGGSGRTSRAAPAWPASTRTAARSATSSTRAPSGSAAATRRRYSTASRPCPRPASSC